MQTLDDYMVNGLAVAMKEKMALNRHKGRSGWDDPAKCSAELLRLMLVHHLYKGDPVDVANFCGMLFARGESTTPDANPTPTAREEELAAALRDLAERAGGFSVSGVYFHEDSGNAKALETAWGLLE